MGPLSPSEDGVGEAGGSFDGLVLPKIESNTESTTPVDFGFATLAAALRCAASIVALTIEGCPGLAACLPAALEVGFGAGAVEAAEAAVVAGAAVFAGAAVLAAAVVSAGVAEFAELAVGCTDSFATEFWLESGGGASVVER